MSYRVVDDLSAPWSSGPTGGLTASLLTLEESGFRGPAMRLTAAGIGTGGAYVQRQFSPALDLTAFSELRLWLRAPRLAQDLNTRPFYLQLTAREDPGDATPGWYRLLPVAAINRWQLVRLWLGDMPAALRGAVGSLRIEALPAAADFDAAVVGFWASAPNPIADFEQAIVDRLHERFTIATDAGPAQVGAVMADPAGAPAIAPPYLLITPLTLAPVSDRGGSGPVQYDNFTFDGAHSRHSLGALGLRYAVDAVADNRAETATALGLAVEALLREPVQLVAGERITMSPFEPDGELAGHFHAAGRAPLFVRAVVPVEPVEREFHPWADAYLRVGPATGAPSSSETVSL